MNNATLPQLTADPQQARQPDDCHAGIISTIAPALCRGGFLRFLRPCAPPSALKTSSGADGSKIPSILQNGAWRPMKGWRESNPSLANLIEWGKWPGAGLCFVTDEIRAFDLDIKFDATDVSDEAERGRSLIRAVVAAIGQAAGAHALPMRTRPNSTSCAAMVRLPSPVSKRALTVTDATTGRTHKIEFLADGQQIVIAGQHESGAPVSSDLPRFTVESVPAITVDALDALMAQISDVAENHGFLCGAKTIATKRERRGCYSPEQAVFRAVMARRGDWLPAVVPCAASGIGEWRITSEALGRELEEDLVVYADGIHDHGTERPHSPLSLICEFGAVTAAGEIEFGGCPEYGSVGERTYAVVGEPDASTRRPTEAEAATWLSGQLAGLDLPRLQHDATHMDVIAALSAAVGLDWLQLQSGVAARYFEGVADTERGPADWSDAELIANVASLPAMQALDPTGFAALVFRWDLLFPTDVNTLIAAEKRRVTEAAVRPRPVAGLFPGSSDAADGEPWPEPRDVFGDGEPDRLLDLPAGAFPAVLDAWARDVADRMGVAPAFTAAAGLAVLSAAIGSKLRIQPKKFDTGWTEPAFLWVGLVEIPGGKKSPIINAATKPLDEIEAEHGNADRPVWAAWKEASKARRKVGEPGPGEEPRVRRYVVEGFTMEALAEVLRHNKAGVLIKQDELTQLIGALDAYKANKGSDRPLLLKLIDGNSARIDRAGKGYTHLENWGASVIGGIQPKKIVEMASNLDADGLLQRFIPIFGDGTNRPQNDRAPDREAMRGYNDLIRGLVEWQSFANEPVRLSDGARVVWEPIAGRVENLRHLPDLSDAWRGHLGKWPGFANRVLLLCHIADRWSTGASIAAPVSSDTAARASRVVDWLLSHAIRFYAECVGIAEEANNARWIAGYLLSRGPRARITRRELGQAHSTLRDPVQVSRAMQHLDVMDWCRAVPGERHDRYGASRWDMNPIVFERFQNRAAQERKRRLEIREQIAKASEQRRNLGQGSD